MLATWAVRKPDMFINWDGPAHSTSCYSCGGLKAELWGYFLSVVSNSPDPQIRVDSKCVRCEARDRGVYG